MRRIAIALVAVGTWSGMALGAGLGLSWNDCAGGAGASNRQDFTCSGAVDQDYDLVLQFEAPVAIPNFVALTAFLDYQNRGGTDLTPFWHYETGGCNSTVSGAAGATLFDDIRDLSDCLTQGYLDPWDGDGSGGFQSIVTYGPDFRRPGNGQWILSGSRVTPIAIVAESSYFALRLRLNNRNRDACAGCGDAGAFLFQNAVLESDDGSAAISIAGVPAAGACVSVNDDPPCDWKTPVQPTSWGRLKALYRH